METIIDNYIETRYYRILNYDNLEPLSVTDLSVAFAENRFYHSGVPIARQGSVDIIVSPPERQEEIDYSCKFVCELTNMDRYLVTDRVALYSLMRAYLPILTLVDNSGKKYKVYEFATFYENGYFSITYIYQDLNLKLNTNNMGDLCYWNDVKYIEIDALTVMLMGLNRADYNITVNNYNQKVKIPITKLDENFPDKFAIGKEIVLNILNDYLNSKQKKDTTLAIGTYTTPFYYVMLRNQCELIDININSIINILFNRTDSDFLNESVHDIGVDLSSDKNSIIRGYRPFVFKLCKTDVHEDITTIVTLFNVFDMCNIEKIKYMDSIQNLRKLIYTERCNDVNDLLTARYNQLTTLHDGYFYEFRDDLCLLVQSVRRCLGIEDYKKEYEHFNEIAKEIIIEHNNIRAQEENDIQTKALNIITIILAVPSVTTIVDIFYNLEVPTIITYPSNKAKLIWVVLTLIVSMSWINKRSIKRSRLAIFIVKIKNTVIKKVKSIVSVK